MDKKDSLFAIADAQQGFFTARQAVKCGYSRANFHRYLTAGEWIKELRGVYRLAHYPVTSHPELVMWSLWSQNKQGEPQGVWSHETALEIYELSDVMPSKNYMTVPKKFRKWTAIPKSLVIHFADLPSTEIITQQGYMITTPLRTIFDIIEEGSLAEDLIVQAIREALQKGLFSRKQLNEFTKYKNSLKLNRVLNDYKF